eukprot:8127466-Pyramimonas_sp.AAC.1
MTTEGEGGKEHHETSEKERPDEAEDERMGRGRIASTLRRNVSRYDLQGEHSLMCAQQVDRC